MQRFRHLNINRPRTTWYVDLMGHLRPPPKRHKFFLIPW